MEAVAAMTATEEPIRESVRAWMTKSGAQCVDWNSALRCTAPAKAIEEAFKTELHEFDQVRWPARGVAGRWLGAAWDRGRAARANLRRPPRPSSPRRTLAGRHQDRLAGAHHPPRAQRH